MKSTVVRLESLSIENFKNVKAGQLSFANGRKAYKTSILGLYGQNGSGKTALIDAIELLQLALKGQAIPEKFADYINVESGNAVLHYEFSVAGDTVRYLKLLKQPRIWQSVRERKFIIGPLLQKRFLVIPMKTNR